MPKVIVASPTERVILGARKSPLVVMSPLDNYPPLDQVLPPSQRQLNYVSEFGMPRPGIQTVQSRNRALAIASQVVQLIMKVLPYVLVVLVRHGNFEPPSFWGRFPCCKTDPTACQTTLGQAIVVGQLAGELWVLLCMLASLVQSVQRAALAAALGQPVLMLAFFFVGVSQKSYVAVVRFMTRFAHAGEVYLICMAGVSGLLFAGAFQPRIPRNGRLASNLLSGVGCLALGFAMVFDVGVESFWEEYMLINCTFCAAVLFLLAILQCIPRWKIVRVPLYFAGLSLYFLCVMFLALLRGKYFTVLAQRGMNLNEIVARQDTLIVLQGAFSATLTNAPALMRWESGIFAAITAVLGVLHSGYTALNVIGTNAKGVLALQIAPTIAMIIGFFVTAAWEVVGWPGQRGSRDQ